MPLILNGGNCRGIGATAAVSLGLPTKRDTAGVSLGLRVICYGQFYTRERAAGDFSAVNSIRAEIEPPPGCGPGLLRGSNGAQKILPGRRGFQGSKPIRERYRRGCGLPGISVVNSYTRKTFASPSVSLRYSSAITVVFLLRKTFAITAAKPPLLPLQNRCKHGGKNPRKTRANTVLLHGVPRCPR